MEKDIKQNVANNLTQLRKKSKLTQNEFASKFNYSGKTVSKWEKGDAMPDIEVLANIASFYNVSLDFLVSEHKEFGEIKSTKLENQKRKIGVALLSTLSVWFLSTIIFAYQNYVGGPNPWLAFIWAVPGSFAILLLNNIAWGKKYFNVVISICFIWSMLFAIYLQLLPLNLWYLFFLGLPLTPMVIIWSAIKKEKK